MAHISATLVKELRERTGAGMMECKKALVDTQGDVELAIDNMRKSGQAKAAKKSGRVASEGVILLEISSEQKLGAILELNCETDFVAKDASFKSFAEEIISTALKEKITSSELLKAKFEEQRTALVAKIGENINIRRIAMLESEALGSYLHGARIGVLVSAVGADQKCLKNLAMHIAASKPEYVHPEDVPSEVVNREHHVQLDIAMQSGKPRDIAEKMVSGRMKKFTGEISLTGQNFVMEPTKTVGDWLEEHGATVLNFIRFEVGEGIEKSTTNFADEVAAISKKEV
ncbi:translation elongation factor Ts [Candidatus Williamhamiltonella defendens]|uniref:Elongation factor Ts n=1 Tax=Candidatus Williamhamiltonella defendens TaxID=138072 RepID=A0A2D3TDU1_9ENTR|nr:translation elongation factor Ts [Candidatus Hamiltonella defensa]ATW33955.1 translation elongation factor Ts [Candidatus Hamiltonella defensa]AYB48765.1 elongation factor Ts [Candidatus Hamiltonella defensa]